ncbi:radical SAM family heme chaperone HemW [Breznakiella homolactica]|uniref:Heme chaperone HemW n=1 Tax=Breznakiella homolactica TaxID=2798577 RepID=A0A7T7XKK5_9SPIR|nr:radical SAM family heme chaperone HemW [Breznakiella homolactica]QQO07977.1 radical SAM family heme chaperone HemW [Breznakiella homolactica]
MTASIYIHIPFCAVKCDYCDFYSVPAESDDPRLDAYVGALIRDTESAAASWNLDSVPSVYIGGGTPSVLGAGRIRRLLRGIAASLPAAALGECTLEANPESLDGALLDAALEGGVTRLSLGVQTFSPEQRRAVRRAGNPDDLQEKLRLAARAFGGNFSADLITGLPFQDESSLLADIEKLLAFGPGHVSLYSLTVEEGTPLERKLRNKTVTLPDEDSADSLWLKGRDVLESAGLRQYEVSNFALPGKRSLHNIRYWRMENWLGIGPAASGTLFSDTGGTARRSTIPEDAAAYIAGTSVPEWEELDAPTVMAETFLMGFRFIEGPDRDLFARRFGITLESAAPETFARWRRKGLLREDAPALTPEGLLFLNAFLREAFDELRQ